MLRSSFRLTKRKVCIKAPNANESQKKIKREPCCCCKNKLVAGDVHASFFLNKLKAYQEKQGQLNNDDGVYRQTLNVLHDYKNKR